MAKLILKPSCYTSTDAAVKKIKETPEHKALVKEADKEIEKGRIRYAAAYYSSKTYLCD